jgi:hypothetical protein
VAKIAGAATASFSTTWAKLIAMTWRKVASGRFRLKRMVIGSTTSMVSIEPKKPAPGLWVAGSSTRSIEYLTSSAVTSRPLVNLAPGRSLKVKVLPSGEIS